MDIVLLYWNYLGDCVVVLEQHTLSYYVRIHLSGSCLNFKMLKC